MSSTIKVNNIQNLAGDDSGIDLSTNDQIILKTANTTALTIDSSQNATFASKLATTNLGTGAVLQVVSTTKTDTFDTTSTSLTDITGLSVTITPNFTTSKVFIILDVHIVGHDSGTGIVLVRGSTEIAKGDTAGSRNAFTSIGQFSPDSSPSKYEGGNTTATFLDSPSTTSATTYKVQGKVLSTKLIVNQTRYDVDNANASRARSTITVMEIAG